MHAQREAGGSKKGGARGALGSVMHRIRTNHSGLPVRQDMRAVGGGRAGALCAPSTLALATKFGAKLVGFITKSAHNLPQKPESEGAKRCRKRGSGGMPAPRRLVLTFAVAAVRVPDLLRL